MTSRSLIFVAALLILGVRAPAGAQSQSSVQTPAKTATIATITVTGSQKVAPDQIISVSGLKPGDVVTSEQIQAAADRLAALGLFSAVNYRFTSKGDTISLEFQVQENQTYPVLFDNFPWFTDEEIAQGIRKEFGLFAGEVPGGGAALDGISAALNDLLAARHIQGHVTHQLLAQPVGDGMMMQFRVEGPTIVVESVQFGDALAENSEQIKDRVSDIKGQTYSRFAIEVFENEHLRPIYASKGYLHAQIGPPEAHLAADSGTASRTGVEISIPIAPGPAYTLGGISWQGNTAIATPNLDGAVELKSGDPVDDGKLEAMWQSIRSTYLSRGYLDAKLDPQPQFDDSAHRVSFRVNIMEGPQYHMGQMIVTGLSVDAEKQLRQMWLIAPGQVFDQAYFDKLAIELAKPSVNIFGEMPVHYTVFGHWLRPDPDKHTVDVLLDFK